MLSHNVLGIIVNTKILVDQGFVHNCFCLLSQGDSGPPGARGNPGRDGKRVCI